MRNHFPYLIFFIFAASQLSAQKYDNPYPVSVTLQIIPYGTNNNLTGPFVSLQVLTPKIVGEISLGESYNDIFKLNVVASNPVYGIKNYLKQIEAGILVVNSVKEKEDVGDFKIHLVKGFRIGAQVFASYHRQLFNAADSFLVPRSGRPGETYMYYHSAFVNTNYTSTILHFGYGSQTVRENEYKTNKGRTRDFYADVLFSLPFMMSYEHVNANGSPFSGVAEQSYKNMLGFRVGMKWTSFSQFGGIVGIETGMRPGVCAVDATYGTGTDIGALNLFYFAFKLGISSGIISNKTK